MNGRRLKTAGLIIGMVWSGFASPSLAVMDALDQAGNYTEVTFIHGANEGYGFGPWQFIPGEDAQIGLLDSSPSLALQGREGMALVTNLLKVIRGGDDLDPLTVTLQSSDPSIASLPASILLADGATATDVSIVGHQLGLVTILASAPGYPDAFFDVFVYDIAYDDASYYPPGVFTDGGDGGTGFQPWIIINNAGEGEGYTNFAGAFIGNSTSGGANVNAGSTAFGMYANRVGEGGDLPFANAIRMFDNELAVGHSVTLEIGINFRNGAKGVAFQNSGVQLFEVGAYNVDGEDGYFYKIGNEVPVDLGWDYASDSAIEIELKRVTASLYDIRINRRGSAPESSPLGLVDWGGNPPDELRFFIFNTEGGGDGNNLYFNRLALFSGEELATLTITGNDGMVSGQINAFTVTRTGPTDDALVVNLASDDELAVAVAATTEIAMGENSATFFVSANDAGFAQITADADGFVGDTFAVDVFDIAYDDTTYYPPAAFENEGGGGFGLEPWVVSVNGGEGEGFTNHVGLLIGNSAPANGNVNSSSGEAFGLYANKEGEGGPDPLAEVIRSFDTLEVGQSISFRIGINFRNGAKGVAFQNSGAQLFEVAAFNFNEADGYFYKIGNEEPVDLGWEYAFDSAISVVFSRNGDTSYNVYLARAGGSPEQLLIQGITLSQAPNQVRFFNYYTDGGGDENNLYFNNLAIYTGTVGEDFTDGIPNSWWEKWSIEPIDRVAANDLDGDGESNEDEYIADTNPNGDINSFFPNLITSAVGTSVLTLQTGPTTNSRVYDIWWTTNLLSNPQQWNRLGLNEPGDDLGGPVELPAPGDVPFRLYRTGVALP